MTISLKNQLLFFAGIVIQFIYLIGGWRMLVSVRRVWLKVLLALLISGYIIYENFLLGTIGLIIYMAWLFRDEILPRMNEIIALQLTIVVWLYIIPFIRISNIVQHPIVAAIGSLLIFPTIAVLALVFTDRLIGKGVQLFIYLWSLAAILILAIPNSFLIGRVIRALLEEQTVQISGMDFFLAGFFLFYCVSHVTLILATIIPVSLEKDDQSIQRSYERMAEYRAFLTTKYDQVQIPIHKTVCIILIQLCFGLTVLIFKLTSPLMLVNLSIVLIQLLNMLIFPRRKRSAGSIVTTPRFMHQS